MTSGTTLLQWHTIAMHCGGKDVTKLEQKPAFEIFTTMCSRELALRSDCLQLTHQLVAPDSYQGRSANPCYHQHKMV